MRRSRLVLCAVLNLLAMAIVGWKFATMASMADIYGLAAVALFGAAFLILRSEQSRASAEKLTSE
jgi:hypothetical protein